MATRSTPSDTTSYAWDTNADVPNLATETDVQGNKAASSTYTYAQGPLGLITSSGSYSFHTDALGSIVEVSDSSGKSSQSYRYDPFGGAYAPGNSSQAASNLSNSLQYAGQYLDEDSDLYYMRAREYDPETARFLETDPVSCEEGGACGSVYVYVDDRPTVETDPSGECPIDDSSGMPRCIRTEQGTTKKGSAKLGWLRLAAFSAALSDAAAGKKEQSARCPWRVNPTTGETEYLNKDPGFTKWYYGQNVCAPWCAIAVSKWFASAGSHAFAKRSRWEGVWSISHAANTKTDHLRWRTGTPQLGDIVVYAFDFGVAEPGDHTGIIWSAWSRNSFLTIEGNTSSGGVGGTGTGSNVDGVYARYRTIPEGPHGFNTAKFVKIVG
jgi:RHS repeat-associated protein